MDSLPSLAQSQGIQIVGVNFHSINFQEPKLHIAVHFLFAKAREKVILRPWFEFLTFGWWWEQIHSGCLNLLDFSFVARNLRILELFLNVKNKIARWATLFLKNICLQETEMPQMLRAEWKNRNCCGLRRVHP